MKTSVSVVTLAVVTLAASAAAQTRLEERIAGLEALTLELVGAPIAAAGSSTPGEIERLLRIAETRRDELRQLVQEEPAAALRLAVPADARALLPAPIQDLVESHETLAGSIEVLQEDDDRGGRRHYFLRTPDRGRVSVHFADNPPALQTGQEVSISGVLVTSALASESAASVVTIMSVAPNTFGEQRTLVILINFQDNVNQPFTPANAADTVFNTVNDWFGENSQNQAWLTGDVAGWFTLPINSTCDYEVLQTRAQAAAKSAGVDLALYDRFVYAFPKISCGWWGLGTVGGDPSHAWVNGPFTLKVVAHEMGHNFGLNHAHALDCGTVTLGPSCSSMEYGDPVDMMGQNGKGHYTAFEKERLGWLNYGSSLPILTLSAPGTYQIDGYATLTAGPKALKILKDINPLNGERTSFYVEYRAPVGFDSYLSGNLKLTGGVLVHTGSDATPDSSFVLDMLPLTTSFGDAALPNGQTFVDSVSGVSITAVSTDGSRATVGVDMPSAPCVAATPLISMSPSSTQYGAAGTTLSWTASVTNKDNEGCADNAIEVRPVAPTGWTAVASPPSLTLRSGETKSAVVQFTSSSSAATSFYTVKAVADPHNGTPVSSATGTYAVMAALALDLTASVSGGSSNRRVVATALVKGSGSPLAGVPVAFTFVKPNGTVVTGTATTDSTGKAQYAVRVRSATGTWSITASATMGAVTTTDAVTVVVK